MKNEEYIQKAYDELKAALHNRSLLEYQTEMAMKEPEFLELEPYHSEPSLEEIMDPDGFITDLKSRILRWVKLRAIQEGLWHPDEPII